MSHDKHLRCSFCGKSKDSVRKFISGPSVYICNECIALCNEILAEDEEREVAEAITQVPTPQEIKDIHRYQVGALAAFARAAGTTLQHVKAHGIQYHMFEENLPLGRASAEQVIELDPNLILMTMAMTKYDAEARKVKGCRVAAEGFADRVYADDGQLVSRKLGKDALVSDPAKAADQAVRMVMEHKVRTITGKVIDAKIDTICIHGDSPGAEKIVAAVRDALVKAGAVVKPLREWFGK